MEIDVRESHTGIADTYRYQIAVRKVMVNRPSIIWISRELGKTCTIGLPLCMWTLLSSIMLSLWSFMMLRR